jgi:hypothetical protein
MTTFFQCIDNAVEGKVLKKKDGERLKEDYRRFRASHANTDPTLAAEQAKRDLYESLSAETAHKRRKAKLSLKNVQDLDADLRSHRTPAGKQDLAAAAIDKLEHFGTGAQFSSVAGRHKAILGMAHAKMERVLHHFRRSMLAGDKIRKNAADLTNVLREAFGVDTGDEAAKGLAKAWKETHEWLRQRFNAAGGAIGELDNWGLPQWHDPRALRNATLPVWKEAIKPRSTSARCATR